MEKAITNADLATLAPALGADAEQVAAEVAAGISQLIRYADGSRIVARVEYDANGGELVIVAGAGRDAPGKVAALVGQATRRGWSVRFHTKRPALGRMLARLGFTESERVYRHGGSSSSSTKRTYQTQNISQQGRANVYGNGNQTTIYRADAITLDNIAAALAAGVEDMSNAGTKQVEAALDAGSDMTRRTLDVTERINRDALDSNTSVTRSAIDSNTSVTRDAMSSLERLSLEIQQGAENGTKQAMDFVSNYTERDQIGSEGEQLRTLQYVAAAVAVALVGIAWASKGSLKA